VLGRLDALHAGELIARKAKEKALAEYTAACRTKEGEAATGDPVRVAADHILRGDGLPPSADAQELARLVREASSAHAAHAEAVRQYQQQTLNPARAAARQRLAADVNETVWGPAVAGFVRLYAEYEAAAVEMCRLREAIRDAGLLVAPVSDAFPRPGVAGAEGGEGGRAETAGGKEGQAEAAGRWLDRSDPLHGLREAWGFRTEIARSQPGMLNRADDAFAGAVADFARSVERMETRLPEALLAGSAEAESAITSALVNGLGSGKGGGGMGEGFGRIENILTKLHIATEIQKSILDRIERKTSPMGAVDLH
jgi:hypothetical protein